MHVECILDVGIRAIADHLRFHRVAGQKRRWLWIVKPCGADIPRISAISHADPDCHWTNGHLIQRAITDAVEFGDFLFRTISNVVVRWVLVDNKMQ